MSNIEPPDEINQNSKPDDTFKHGYFFRPPGRFVGFALTFGGFFMCISFLIVPMLIGSLILAFGVYMLTGTSGVEINYSKNIFKEYYTIIGIKFGKWVSLDPYPFLSIMSANKSNNASDITGLNKTVVSDLAYGIYLLNNSHRKKVLLKRTPQIMDQTVLEAEKIAELTGKELMKYNPRRLLKNR